MGKLFYEQIKTDLESVTLQSEMGFSSSVFWVNQNPVGVA